MHNEQFTLLYPDVFALMRELKALGASNSNRGRSKTLTGKQALNSMIRHYRTTYGAGRIPATFEAIYGHAWAPQPGQSRDGQAGDVAIPIASISRRRQ